MRIAFQQHFTTISSGSNFKDCKARNRQAEWSKNIAEWAAFVANFLMAIYVWKTSLLSDILLWLYDINKNWTIIAELRSVRSRLEEEQRARQRIENELDQHNEKVTNIPGKGITDRLLRTRISSNIPGKHRHVTSTITRRITSGSSWRSPCAARSVMWGTV